MKGQSDMSTEAPAGHLFKKWFPSLPCVFKKWQLPDSGPLDG